MHNPRLYRRCLFATAISVWLCAETHAKPAANQPRVSYTLHARLQPRGGSGFDIEGRGTIDVDNRSPLPLSTIPLHLYMNAFRDEQSLARRSPFHAGRATQLPGSFGSIELTRCVDARSQSALMPTFSSEDPDRTTATVTLPTPIEPGARATLGVEWTVHLPRIAQRTGYERDFVFAGQWFPKLAKLEPNGTWVQFPFHPQAEFYANFGDYDVTLELPLASRFGATGQLVQQSAGESITARYVAHDVHDFAWTAWPQFTEHTEQINGIQVSLLFPPGQSHNRELTSRTLDLVLPWITEWLGPYPHPTLTVVHPPAFAEGSGGMEYPGLITTGGSVWAGYTSHDIQRVVIHELAHQWFYGLVASNEYAWPFLDEGLTTYVEDRAMIALFTSRWDIFSNFLASTEQRVFARQYGEDVSIATPGAEFPSFDHLAALAYDRTALLLETLRRTHGPGFDGAFRGYARRFRHAHPTPEDFIGTISETLGGTAEQTLRSALFERGQVNYRVSDLQSHLARDGGGYVNRFVLTRQGDLVFPTHVEIREASRPARRISWDTSKSVEVIEFTSQTPVDSVCVDPAAAVAIEETRADNCVRRQRPALPRYWGAVLGWLQVFLTWVA